MCLERTTNQTGAKMIDNFYKAFEDKFRGSRELILQRLKVYIPFLKIIHTIYPHSIVIDLGCGRGEWLEFTGEFGFKSHGIDMDVGMLENAKSFGLSAELGDAVEYLKTLSDESVSIISGFHIAEHLPFDILQSLVQETYRVLKPAGLLILETPNPENIRVATADFYLDPTHTRPIPSQLLAFLSEYYGFSRTKILRLQETIELANSDTVNILQLIEGVSPDYAIIAQKQSSGEMMAQFDDLFLAEYGLALDVLANRFENRLLKIEAEAKETFIFKQTVQDSIIWKISQFINSITKKTK